MATILFSSNCSTRTSSNDDYDDDDDDDGYEPSYYPMKNGVGKRRFREVVLMNLWTHSKLKFLEDSMVKNPHLSNNEIARRIMSNPVLTGRIFDAIEQKIGELKRTRKKN